MNSMVKEYERTQSEVKVGRLERKIDKLKQQRDHYKELYTNYLVIMKELPTIESRYRYYKNRIDEFQQERVKSRNLEIRVFEQAQLIKLLNDKISDMTAKVSR